MHVDLNSFFPSCEEPRDPTLKEKPDAVIMTDETKDKITRGAVASCSYGARKYGVMSATKSAAKVASDFKKPDGFTVIYPDQLQKFLENLEVDRIAGIGTKTQQVLKDEMGIQTIGQLAKYDIQKLKDRFGKKNGLWMRQVANGRDSDDPVLPREDNISLSTEQTLDRATSDRAKILQHLNQHVDEVYERVRKHGYEFRTVGVKLVRSDFSSIETRETSFSNSSDRESIASVLQGLVDRFSFFNNNDNTNAATITYRKVGIKLSNLQRIERKKKSSQQRTLLDYT
jgi:DNA polymerase IV (DinB-like DNA polymerase)